MYNNNRNKKNFEATFMSRLCKYKYNITYGEVVDTKVSPASTISVS